MRGKLNEGEEKPDAELREKLHAMESRVRKMRETRNNFNAQAKVSAEKRNSVQSQYKEHRKDSIHKEVFDHSGFNALLQKNVSAEGKVNYKAFKKDRTVLRMYLHALGRKTPTENWSKQEKLAYWINAYNAMTIDLIIRNQPIGSIKDIENPWRKHGNIPL